MSSGESIGRSQRGVKCRDDTPLDQFRLLVNRHVHRGYVGNVNMVMDHFSLVALAVTRGNFGINRFGMVYDDGLGVGIEYFLAAKLRISQCR